MYSQASQANVDAIKVDDKYFQACKVNENGYNSYYHELYYCHKHAFLVYSAAMEGRSLLAVSAARNLTSKCHIQYVGEDIRGIFQTYGPWLLQTLLRFGKWDEVLKVVSNIKRQETLMRQNSMSLRKLSIVKSSTLDYTYAIADYAAAFSYASLAPTSNNSSMRMETCNSARTNLNRFLVRAASGLRKEKLFLIDFGTLLDMATYTLFGRLTETCPEVVPLAREPTFYWAKAVKVQDGLPYMEPPFWPMNIRACFGNSLLKSSSKHVSIINVPL